MPPEEKLGIPPPTTRPLAGKSRTCFSRPMQPTFRFATARDIEPLGELIERAYRGGEAAKTWTNEAALIEGPRSSHEEIAGIITKPDSRFVLAERAGQLLGCALIEKN